VVDRVGVVVDQQFYPFTPHFLAFRAEGRHRRATDSRIRQILTRPDFVETTSGNREVYWGYFREYNWWIKVVLVDNPDGPAILTAYEDTERGQRRWEALQ
jgi:hypothetical protein